MKKIITSFTLAFTLIFSSIAFAGMTSSQWILTQQVVNPANPIFWSCYYYRYLYMNGSMLTTQYNPNPVVIWGMCPLVINPVDLPLHGSSGNYSGTTSTNTVKR